MEDRTVKNRAESKARQGRTRHVRVGQGMAGQGIGTQERKN